MASLLTKPCRFTLSLILVQDSDYLKRTVGPALTNALTAMVTDQPKDSVEVTDAHRGPLWSL